MKDSLPLFPLGSLLFPSGRMALQIFEPRYMDLIKRCLRDDSGFGIVGIESGAEVATPNPSGESAISQIVPPNLYGIGVIANIVDWHGLEHGRIGIVVEGGKRFEIGDTHVQDDYLMTAEVNYLPEQEEILLPTGYADFAGMLKQLALHPSVVELGASFCYTSANQVAYSLAQLLPIAREEKYKLLDCDSALEVLAKIRLITDRLSGRQS